MPEAAIDTDEIRGDVSPDEAGSEPVEILGIAGSLRSGSFNRALVRAAAEEAPSRVRWRTYDELARVPPYDQDRDVDPPPAAVAHLRGSIRRADALLVATPEYNHSVPGVLKNAVDWASRPYGEAALVDRPVAVIGASPSDYGAKWAQEDLRRVLEAAGAEVLETELAVSRADERIEDGRLLDGEVRVALRRVVEALVRRGSASSRGEGRQEPGAEPGAQARKSA